MTSQLLKIEPTLESLETRLLYLEKMREMDVTYFLYSRDRIKELERKVMQLEIIANAKNNNDSGV